MSEQIALGLLEIDKKILLVKQDYGGHFWTLPGGTVEPGESFIEAAVREFREETGLEVMVSGLAAFSQRRGLICIVFFVQMMSGTLMKSGPEVEATGWFNAADFLSTENEVEDYTRLIAGAALRGGLRPLSPTIYPGRNGQADLFL